ncbi:MAG: hypothetical protein IPO92_13205 [Saprospiraceae bacterium]|nr:hypothetical protein [Saprospiraceae bacterium]
MENILIHKLDEVLTSVERLKEKYKLLSGQNEILTNQISILKVETEKYKQEIKKIKEASEKKDVDGVISILPKSDVPSSEEIEALKNEQKEKNAQIKLQLDGFIEDIDQCIQIIQAKP